MKKKIFLYFLILLFGLSGCNNSSDKSIFDKAYNDLKLPASLEQSIELPTIINLNTTVVEVSWISSDENIIDLKGNIYRQTEDKRVILTAVLSLNEISKTKEFVILVLGMDSNTIAIRTNSDTNEVFEVKYIEKNSDELIIKEPTSEFATFMGWYLDPSFLEPFDINTPLSSSIDLYAKWDVRQYEVEINYTGFLDKTEVAYIPYQGLLNISQFLDLGQHTILKSISIADKDFQIGLINKHRRKFSIFVDTIEREYNIYYYEQAYDEIDFKKYFINYIDNNTFITYGISFDNKIYSIGSEGNEPIQFDLGTLELDHDDEIVDVFQSGGHVYAVSQKDNIYRLYKEYNTGGYNDITPIQYRGYNEILGSFIKLSQSFSSLEVTAIYNNGIVALTRSTENPFIYILEDKNDSVIDAVDFMNDYYILTSKSRLHYVSRWFSGEKEEYWDVTDSLGLLVGEKIIQLFTLERDSLYLLTSNNRIILYKDYSQDYHNPNQPNTSIDLNLDFGENAESINNAYLKTDKNTYYSIGFTGQTKKLSLPLNEDEYIINQFPTVRGYNYLAPLFITNTRNVIVRNQETREFERIDNLILDEDEEVLSYYSMPIDYYDKYIITTKQAYLIHSTTVDYELLDEIYNTIGNSDIVHLYWQDEMFSATTIDGTQYYHYNGEHTIVRTPKIWNITKKVALKYNDDIPLDYEEIPFVERGWSIQVGRITPPSPKATADLNLYLFHDVNSYELKFVTNSSLEIDPIIVKRNEENRTPTPSLDSKYFVGWYLDQDFKTKLGYLEYGKSYTVYARWSNPSYFIYYHNSGGIEATEIKAGFGPEVTNQIPYKAGYYFNGWVDEEGNPFWSTWEPHYDDIHLYATFERELINISLMDNNDKWYSISGRYEDSLADLVDKVPGMKIKAFYSDSSFTNKLSLDTLIYSTRTFYVDIEAIPVPIILLEEILSAPNAKFSLVNDYLLVENDNNIYFYNYYKKGLLDDNKEYSYLDPLNLTNSININKIEDILYIKELKDFIIVIVDNKIYYISKETLQLEKTFNIALQDNEKLIKDRITSIPTWSWLEQSIAFAFVTTKDRLITIDSSEKVNYYSSYTIKAISPTGYVILESKDRLWVIFIDKSNNLVFKEVENTYIENREQNLIGSTLIDDYYYEVYKDGSLQQYDFHNELGLYKNNYRELNLELQNGEEIINIFGQYAYTSNNRMIDINYAKRYLSYNLLANEEFSYAVSIERHQIVFVTNQNRVFTDYISEPIITLQLNERVLYYFEEKLITNYGFYYFDFEQEKWIFRKDFLDNVETIIDVSQGFAITSSYKAIFIAVPIDQTFKLITFTQYKLSEVVYKLYDSSPELPTYSDGFEGWYKEQYFLTKFEKVTNGNYVVLYPKWK